MEASGWCLVLGCFFSGCRMPPSGAFWWPSCGLSPTWARWIAAGLPITLSLVVFPGWTQPLLASGLFVLLELTTNSVLEPLLYGHSTGISQVALLVAVLFWTWLWGPVGLLLSTPLTVCLSVLGKYVQPLAFLGVDALALRMFQQVCDPTRYEVELLTPRLLTSEVVALVGQTCPALLCIGAVSPGGVPHLRYLCKQLRARLPALRIVVGCWGG